jgi:adenylate cyclase
LPEFAADYAQSLELYRARRFEEARERLLRHSGDGVSRYLAGRCEQWLRTPPPPEWDGIHVLESK